MEKLILRRWQTSIFIISVCLMGGCDDRSVGGANLKPVIDLSADEESPADEAAQNPEPDVDNQPNPDEIDPVIPIEPPVEPVCTYQQSMYKYVSIRGEIPAGFSPSKEEGYSLAPVDNIVGGVVIGENPPIANLSINSFIWSQDLSGWNWLGNFYQSIYYSLGSGIYAFDESNRGYGSRVGRVDPNLQDIRQVAIEAIPDSDGRYSVHEFDVKSIASLPNEPKWSRVTAASKNGRYLLIELGISNFMNEDQLILYDRIAERSVKIELLEYSYPSFAHVNDSGVVAVTFSKNGKASAFRRTSDGIYQNIHNELFSDKIGSWTFGLDEQGTILVRHRQSATSERKFTLVDSSMHFTNAPTGDYLVDSLNSPMNNQHTIVFTERLGSDLSLVVRQRNGSITKLSASNVEGLPVGEKLIKVGQIRDDGAMAVTTSVIGSTPWSRAALLLPCR